MSVCEDNSTAAALPTWFHPATNAAIVVGAIGTLAGLFLFHDRQMWWMLLVNFTLWTGIAQGAFIWSTILRTGQSVWAAGVNRLGMACIGFLPFSMLLLLLLWVGAPNWLTWMNHPEPRLSGWLNTPFFFIRNLALLVAMALLGYLYITMYRQSENAAPGPDQERAHNRINKLAVVLVLFFAFGYSMQGFDLIMSLTPHWCSTMFGGYYFTGDLYAGMAALILMARFLRRPFGLAEHLGPERFTDMGNLMMGFGMFFTGIMFAQWLTIWYGNLPEEISYLLPRIYSQPWATVGWILVATCYLGPFLLLQSQALKADARRLSHVAILVIVAMFIERWYLIVPTLSPHRIAGLGPLTWCIPLLCAGVLVKTVLASLTADSRVSTLDLVLELD